MANLMIDHEAIERICRAHNVRELAVFGSAARGELRADSDVDVLVTFAEDAHPSLFTLVDLKEEFSGVFRRDVDVLTRRSVEGSKNDRLREAILGSATRLYAA